MKKNVIFGVVQSLLVLLVIWLCLFFVVMSFFPMTVEQGFVREWLYSGHGRLSLDVFESSHMGDVRFLFDGARLFFVLGLFLSLFLLSKRGFREEKIVGCCLVAIPLLLSFIPWDVTFELFHKVFFPMGNYTFSPSSILIMLFPSSFFLSFAITWGVLSVLTGLFVLFRRKIITFV